MKEIAIINCHENIHLRPATLLINLRKCFPDTAISIKRVSDEDDEPITLDSIIDLTFAKFQDGEHVEIQAEGAAAELAVKLFRLAIENMKDPSQTNLETGNVDYDRVKMRVFGIIDETFAEMPEETLFALAASAERVTSTMDREIRRLAYLNDRLHNLTVPVLPAIAKYFQCCVELRFETALGIHVCRLLPDANEDVISDILAAEPDAGTRITIVVGGNSQKRCSEAAESVQCVLNNLRECDEWLRQRNANLAHEEIVKGLISFAENISRLRKNARVGEAVPEISRLLSEDRIVVYLASSILSKEEVIHQLVAIQSTRCLSMLEDEVMKAVWLREKREPVVLRPGLACPHAPVQHGPRIAISVAIVPRGVEWVSGQAPVKLIFLFLFSEDTHRTYLEHMGQLAAVLRSDTLLQDALICAKNSREALQLIRGAEDVMQSRIYSAISDDAPKGTTDSVLRDSGITMV